jgi:hypothetical protein
MKLLDNLAHFHLKIFALSRLCYLLFLKNATVALTGIKRALKIYLKNVKVPIKSIKGYLKRCMGSKKQPMLRLRV